MDRDSFVQIVTAQFDAALWMLHDALTACPADEWDAIVGRYPVWMVAHHVLCFVDVYASPSDEAWRPDTGPTGMHPLGRKELEEEYPSRRFDRDELVGYLVRCRDQVRAALAAETSDSLAGPSGFPRLKFSRAELYLYSLRHVQHHTGQLTALLRRAEVDTRWKGTGWPA